MAVDLAWSRAAGTGADQRYNKDGDGEEEKDGQRRGTKRLKRLAGLVVLVRGASVDGVNGAVDVVPTCSSLQGKG